MRIVKREPGARSRGRALVEHMRGRGSGRRSTDEILRLRTPRCLGSHC